jgi:DNA-binding transcriptional LysR family regulator
MYLSQHVVSHLPFLAAVARRGSFTLAGESLSVSQAAVSYQIRQLEQKLGLLLVVRQSGSRIYLTRAGQTLVDEYLDCERRLQLTLENLGSDEPLGSLNMTVPVDFGSVVMPVVMARLRELAPGLKLNLHVSDDVMDLVANQFDLALRGRSDMTGLKVRAVARSRKQLVASRSYLELHGRPQGIEDLVEHQVLVRDSRNTLSWEQLLCQEGGLSLNDLPQKTMLGNTFALAESVRQGLGIAILPRFVLVSELQQGLVVPLLTQFNAPLITDFFLAHLPAPQISRFAGLIENTLLSVIGNKPFDSCFAPLP